MTTHEIGGKAANLLALQSVARVKPFVTVTVSEVERTLIDGVLPTEVKERIENLSKDILYAVRSSGVNEDSAGHSWAGVFLTELDVPHHGIEAAIHKCIAAIGTKEAVVYAKSHNATIGGLAIIIQEMVAAECAGVLFTKNPVGSDGYMVVEAVKGNAEKLVSGTAEPARYFLSQVGGVVREEHQNGFRLSHARLHELFARAVKIRETLGGEQDIEFAYATDGLLYINQSRPVTSLDALFDDPATMAAGELNGHLAREHRRLGDLGCRISFDVLSNQNIAELLSKKPSYMAHGLFRYLFADSDGAIKTGRNAMGYEIGSELDQGFHILVGGEPRVSIIHDAFSYRIRGIPLPDYMRIVQDYLWQISENESLANYPEVSLYDQNPSFNTLAKLFDDEKAQRYSAAYAQFFEGISALEDELIKTVMLRFVPEWHETMAERKAHADETLEQHIDHFREMCDLLRTDACHMFVKVARLGFFAYARARDALIRAFGKRVGEDYLNTLLGAVDPKSPNFCFQAALFELTGSGDIEKLLREFGHLAEHELEISLPRYHEQPEILRLLSEKTASPTKRHEASQDACIELVQTLRENFALTWRSIEHDVDMAQQYLLLREIVKYEYLKGYDILRRHALAIEKKLDWKEGLIFELEPKEIFDLLSDPEMYHGTALTRRSARQRNENLYVPAVIRTDHLETIGRSPSADITDTLRGIGVTNHVTEGECVVIRSLSDTDTLAKIRPGCVLVTENTDPAWSPVIAALGHKGAMVTEIGGLLAHTATCARELGIAAVLNVTNATTVLKTGMRVRVDGPAGRVDILR